jgi:formylglycine-generating enzyme required for sulfatase activity
MRRVVLLAGAGATLSLAACDDSGHARFVHFGAARTFVAALAYEAPQAAPAICPAEMQLVEGAACRVARHRCVRWMDKPGRFRRCAEYAKPATCVLELRRERRFCIDRDEYVAAGATTPLTGKTMLQAERVCKNDGKRLCRESEWNFACEGPSVQPYPYGFSRDTNACNADKKTLVGTDSVMVSLAVPPGSHPSCTSPFGVRDMTGNVEEWVVRDDYPRRGAMKGSYWIPAENHCRAAQRIHGPQYSGVELGFRCCADAQ